MQSKRTYLVTGATGHVGNRVARKLLEAGNAVRAFGRDKGRLAPLAELGASPFVGDMLDAASVLEAFRDVDAALLIGQGDRGAYNYRATFALCGANYAAAARATGLKSAVFISSQGVHDDRNRGVAMIHADIERALNDVSGLNVLNVRAPIFFEDLFYYFHPMQQAGALVWPVATDAMMDMAGTRDVADYAARRLTQLDFQGASTTEIHGPELLTLRQVTKMISDALGRPMPARPGTREDDADAMVAAGMGRDFAYTMNDAWDTFSRRVGRGVEPTAASRLTYRMEDFIRNELVPALQAPTAKAG